MSCTAPHKIELINLNPGETYSYELVLIKGLIANRCSSHVSVGLVNFKTGFYGHSQLSRQGEFKILCKLAEGKQEININYCNITHKITVQYIESQDAYQIQPLYLICRGHDGSFKNNQGDNSYQEACRIIDLNLKLVQCLYAEKLHENGFGRKTFTLKSNCQVFKSRLDVNEARKLDENRLWIEFGREILNSEYGMDKTLKFVAFIGCTQYEKITNGDFSYENIKNHLRAHAALGGGGLALFGSGYFYTWPRSIQEIIPCFTNSEKIDLENFPDDSNYRRTLGGVYASTLGAVCHEIGHIFDLGHTRQGIMGNGFDYINRVFTIYNFTENLPERIVEEKALQRKDFRLTRLKRNSNDFLSKYHEQKTSDSVYFSRNCLVILAHHRWLNIDSGEESQLSLCVAKNVLTSSNPLALVEFREKKNAVISEFFEFKLEDKVEVFHLPANCDLSKFNLFAICADGSMKLFECHLD